MRIVTVQCILALLASLRAASWLRKIYSCARRSSICNNRLCYFITLSTECQCKEELVINRRLVPTWIPPSIRKPNLFRNHLHCLHSRLRFHLHRRFRLKTSFLTNSVFRRFLRHNIKLLIFRIRLRHWHNNWLALFR